MSRNEQNANSEAVFGIVPMLTKERTHGFWKMAALTSIWALAPWCFTQGSAIVSVLGLKAALTNLIGIIVLFSIIYLLTVVIPTRDGIDTWVYQRAVFGNKGYAVLWLILMLSTWGWEAILCQIYGSSIGSLFQMATGSEMNGTAVLLIGATCVVIGSAIACMGPDIITKISYVVIPGIIIACIVILYYVFSHYSWNELMSMKATSEGGSFHENYMLATEWNLAFVCAWYGSMGVLSRLGKSERASYWGFMAGFGVVYALIACVGAIGSIAVTDMTGVYSTDPAEWFTQMGGGIAVLCLICLIATDIAVMAVAMYSLSVSTKVILPKWKYTWIVVLWSVWILFLYFSGVMGEYYNVFLAVVGFIGGPSIMIVLVDYFLVRKRTFSMANIFNQTRESKYYYTKGFNLAGIAAFLCGTIAYFAVYDPINGVGRSFLFNILTGTGSSCIAAAAVYYLLSKVPRVRAYLLRDQKQQTNENV